MKIGKVINGDGYIIETVAYTKDSIYMYELQKGETLIKDEIPAGMLKPRWDSKKWEETATEEEIKESQKVEEIEGVKTIDDLEKELDTLKTEMKAKESAEKIKMMGLMEMNNRIRELEGKLW